jgi:hypothetical protein
VKTNKKLHADGNITCKTNYLSDLTRKNVRYTLNFLAEWKARDAAEVMRMSVRALTVFTNYILAEGSRLGFVAIILANVHSIIHLGTACKVQGSIKLQNLQGGRYLKISRVTFVSENLKADSDFLVA